MGSAFRRPFNNLNNSNNDFLKDRRPGLLGNSLNTYNQPGTSNYYGLTSFELDKLKRFFAAVGGRDRAISFQEFFYFFAMMNPDIKGLKLFDLAEKSFMYSDTDKDGYLNFDEFVRFYLSRFPGGLPGGFPDLDYSHFENHFQRQRCGDCEPSRTYKCSDDFIDCAPRRKSCLPAVEYAPRSVYKTREVEYIDDLPRHESYRVRKTRVPRRKEVAFVDDYDRHRPGPARVYSLDRMPFRKTSIIPRDYIEYY